MLTFSNGLEAMRQLYSVVKESKSRLGRVVEPCISRMLTGSACQLGPRMCRRYQSGEPQPHRQPTLR
jgi:hypothetical protein